MCGYIYLFARFFQSSKPSIFRHRDRASSNLRVPLLALARSMVVPLKNRLSLLPRRRCYQPCPLLSRGWRRGGCWDSGGARGVQSGLATRYMSTRTHASTHVRTHAADTDGRTDGHTHTHTHSHTQEVVREARALRVQLLSEAQDRRATVRRIEVLSCTWLGNCNICAAYADASHCAPRRIA